MTSRTTTPEDAPTDLVTGHALAPPARGAIGAGRLRAANRALGKPAVIDIASYERSNPLSGAQPDVVLENAPKIVEAGMPEVPSGATLAEAGRVAALLGAALLVVGVYVGLPLVLVTRDLLGALPNAVLLTVALVTLVVVGVLAVLQLTTTAPRHSGAHRATPIRYSAIAQSQRLQLATIVSLVASLALLVGAIILWV